MHFKQVTVGEEERSRIFQSLLCILLLVQSNSVITSLNGKNKRVVINDCRSKARSIARKGMIFSDKIQASGILFKCLWYGVF